VRFFLTPYQRHKLILDDEYWENRAKYTRASIDEEAINKEIVEYWNDEKTNSEENPPK